MSRREARSSVTYTCPGEGAVAMASPAWDLKPPRPATVPFVMPYTDAVGSESSDRWFLMPAGALRNHSTDST